MENDAYLTVETALKCVRDLGINVTERQWRRWVHEDKKFPFFRMGRKLYILDEALRKTLRKFQTHTPE